MTFPDAAGETIGSHKGTKRGVEEGCVVRSAIVARVGKQRTGIESEGKEMNETMGWISESVEQRTGSDPRQTPYGADPQARKG
jgi:hypothetical protein